MCIRDRIIIDEIIIVGFIRGSLDSSSQLRKHHDFQIIVFQENGVVGYVLFFIIDFIDDGMGIYLALSLIHI